ncbi:MAG: MFS transporter [Anaerolineae bacterium]
MRPTHIQPRYLEPKAFYFFYFAALAALQPYLALYYRSLGLSGSAIGILSAIPSLVALVSSPLWAALADRHGSHKLVLVCAAAGALVLGYAISLVQGLAALMLLVACYAAFRAPIVALADSSVLVLLGSHKELYGRQRLWGAIGWGLAAPLVGELTQRWGLHWAFYTYIPLGIGFLVSAWVLPNNRPPIRAAVWHGIRDLFRRPAWVVFLISMFLAGFGSSANSNYLFLHLQDIGGTRSLMGIALAVSSISEIFIFSVAGRLLRIWGARRMLMLALAASSLRLFLYSMLRSPLWVLPIQLFHGLAFSLLWTAGVAYADSLAPTGLGATAQAVFGAVEAGLAVVLGSLIGGIIYDTAGSAAIFRWSSLAVSAGLVFLISTGRSKAAT